MKNDQADPKISLTNVVCSSVYNSKMNIIKHYFSRSHRNNVVEIKASNTHHKNVVQTGSVLLKRTKHRHFQIVKTHQCISATKDVWEQNYLVTIIKFAELVQELPASKEYHHSYTGGLLDHSLETMANAVRISTGYILPPGAVAEDISKHVERWRMGIMITALLHDVGKVIADYEVMVNTGSAWVKSIPIYDGWPIGSEYKFRYRPAVKGHTKSLHERSSLLVFKELVNKKMFSWLQEDPELLQQILDTLTYVESGKNTIKDIVITADIASVKTALGEKPFRTADSEVPIADRIMAVIRNMIREGDMKINAPGASMWCTKDYSFLVSKRVMDDVMLQLKRLGDKNIPNNVEKFYQILSNAGYAEHNPVHDNEIIWLCEIKDYARNWNGKLTFLAFQNVKLISDHDLPIFDGTIELMERNKKDYAHIIFTPEGVSNTNVSASFETTNSPASEVPLKNAVTRGKEPLESTEIIETNPSVEKNSDGSEIAHRTDKLIGNDPRALELCDTKIGLRSISQEQLMTLQYLSRQQQQVLLMNNPFINCLINGVKSHKIECNKPGAPVHIAADFILLTSPSAFIKFFKTRGNQMKERVYKTHYSTAYSGLQKELESLGINVKAKGGKNIHTIKIVGKEKTGHIYAYAINRKYFPTMDSYSPNPVIQLPPELLS